MRTVEALKSFAKPKYDRHRWIGKDGAHSPWIKSLSHSGSSGFPSGKQDTMAITKGI